MPTNQWLDLRKGSRRIPKDLEFNDGVTVKRVNDAFRDSGYIIKLAGYDRSCEWPVYRIDRLHGTKDCLTDPFVRVYALGDYTVKQWVKILNKRLKETSQQATNAAKKRRYRAKVKRKSQGT